MIVYILTARGWVEAVLSFCHLYYKLVFDKAGERVLK
jgi:hypothetical protein